MNREVYDSMIPVKKRSNRSGMEENGKNWRKMVKNEEKWVSQVC